MSVPVHASATPEEELNRFLSGHRVLSVDRQLVADGVRSVWAVCVAYVDGAAAPAAGPGMAAPAGQKRVDYREILPAAEFEVFAKLRELRKTLAEREGVPPYAVFTNEHLAEMARGKVQSAADLGRIDGVGPARVQKYAEAFLAILRAASAKEQPA